jgi:tRNA G18 (ribose-2'-O)-methylase SpoU
MDDGDDNRANVRAVHSLDDPAVSDYRNLKDRELARAGGKFIAEGELVVRRLLASDFAVESVLLAERRVAEIAPLVPPHVPIYSAGAGVVDRILGFQFHSGVIAVGRRKPSPSLDAVARAWGPAATLVVLPEVNKTDNLGALLRICGAFGADAVLLGPRCCDPFYRESARVSMGAVFVLPLVRSADLAADLSGLRQRWGVELVATVLDESAEALAGAARGPRLGLLFGNEAQGLGPELTALCDRKVRIPMKLGTDSLNVAIAAAVFLYHFTLGQAQRPQG